MIKQSDIHNQIKDIVENRSDYDEGSNIEWKVIPHKPNSMCEFLKDILGLLNCIERVDEDKFLIYGIENKTKKLVGISISDMLDDADYQIFFDKIEPRPTISFGTIDAAELDENLKGRYVGFFYIPSENTGKIYELSEEYIDNNNDARYKKRYAPGTSFIREGSKTRPLRQKDRDSIRSVIKQPSEFYSSLSKYPSLTDKHGVTPFALAAVLGSWDENDSNDLSLIESLSGLVYEDWIAPIRMQVLGGSDLIMLNRTTWNVKDRFRLVELCGAELTERILNNYKPTVIAAIENIDAKFELEPKKRMAATLYGNGPTYSGSLQHGVAEFLALAGNNSDKFKNCSAPFLKDYTGKVVFEIVNSDDWMVLASAQAVLPLLAEANPGAYLASIQHSLRNGNGLKDYLSQHEDGIFQAQHGSSLALGIRVTARLSDYFVKAITILVALSEYYDSVKDILVGILLPWLPQTDAPLDAQKSVGKYLAKAKSEQAWKALIELLPNVTTTGMANYEPIYLQVPPLPSTVKLAVFWDISRSYAEAAIDGAAGSIDRSLDLLSHLNAFNASGQTGDLLAALLKTCRATSPEEEYEVWASVKDYLRRCNAYPEATWIPDDETLDQIRNFELSTRPSNALLRAKRLFDNYESKLFEVSDWQTGRERLRHEQVLALESVFSDESLNGINALLKTAISPEGFGSICAECEFSDSLLDNLSTYLESRDSRLNSFARGLLQTTFSIDEASLLGRFPDQKWSRETIALFYAALPCVRRVWERAEASLSSESDIYWKAARISFEIDSVDNLRYIVGRFNAVDRWQESLSAIGHCLHEGMEPDADTVLFTLKNYKVSDSSSLGTYLIADVLRWLEGKKPGDELFILECLYYPLIEEDDEPYISKRLASDPDAFEQLLECLYHEHSASKQEMSEEKEQLATRAFEVFWHWHYQPGRTDDGTIDKDAFDSWTDAALALADKADRRGAAEDIIGRNLFYAPPSSDGFFIDKKVASFLEEHEIARQGYECEAVNSRGATWVDPTGKPEFEVAEQYEKKAREADAQGFLNFGISLRAIAEGFRNYGRRIQEEEN